MSESILSETVRNIVPSGTIAINARVFEIKNEGTEVINLSVGEPDFNTPDQAKEGAARAMRENLTRYDKVAGLIELRREICRKLREENGVEYTPEEIVVTNGAKQAITNTCIALLNRGDEVIIPSPYWVSYPEIVKIAGGVPVFAETKPEHDFKLTADDILRYATPRTKMIILCNPSNPLGTIHTKEELRGIAEVCASCGIFILADEVYERIDFNGEFVSMAAVSAEARKMTVIVNGLSKSIPMTGWRIGYTACSEEITRAMVALQGHITSHPSTISQWAGVEGLRSCADYTEMMVGEYRKRMEAATAFLRRELPEIGFIEPKGAFYLFLDITSLKDRIRGESPSYSYNFVMRLLNEKHVAIVPGSAFGKEGYLRIAYATDMDTLMRGLEKIRDFVREL